MDKEEMVDSALESLVKELVSISSDTKSFVADQAPDLAKQFIAERMVDLISDGFLALVLFGIGVACMTWLHGWQYVPNPESFHYYYDDYMVCKFIGYFFSGLGTAVGFSCLVSTADKVFKLKVAPKVYLLRELKELVSRDNS